MSERDFTVTVRVVKTVDEYYTVSAKSFEEAQDLVKAGCGVLDDDDIVDVDNEGVTLVECNECGGNSDYCTCGEPDATVNPDHETGLTPEDLRGGMWVIPDTWTRLHADITGGAMKVVYIGERDDDNEYYFEWQCDDPDCCDEGHTTHDTYLPYPARFQETSAPTLSDEEREAAEKEREERIAEAESAIRRNTYLNELLGV